MIRIYRDNALKNCYYFREGSRVARFNLKTNSVESNASLRLELLFKTYTVTELKRGSKGYSNILKRYESLLADLPLPNRYDFHVLMEDTPANMEEQVKALKIKPYWNCA